MYSLVSVGHGFDALKVKGFKGINLEKNLYIKCELCGDMISLHPRKAERCSCGNIEKDIDEGIFKCGSGIENAEIFEKRFRLL